MRPKVDPVPTAAPLAAGAMAPAAQGSAQPALAGRQPGMPVQEKVGYFLRGTSLNRALAVVGDWWTQRILREAFLGVRHFDAFQAHLAIPRQTLTVRLRSLVTHGVLAHGGDGYRLTPRGLALYPWALMVWRWSRRWAGAAGPRHPPRLVHLDCGQAMQPMFACGACLQEVNLRDVAYEVLPQRASRERARPTPGSADTPAAARRWMAAREVLGDGQAAHHIAFITADRWTHLVLSAVFLGCHAFDELQRAIGISSNILAQRLALLVHTGFLRKARSREDGRRYDYRLTPRSRDVFPITIALVQWADACLPGDAGPPLRRRHLPCGAHLQARVICSHCQGDLLPHRVRFEALPSSLE